MKANQISNYERVQIIGQERAQRRGRSVSARNVSMRRIVIIVTVLVLAAAGVGGYFLITANRLKGANYYMLILNTAPTTVKAQEASESIAKAGGSGYIINDGQLKVSAALYDSLSNAEKVLERLKADYPDAHIVTYALKAKNVDKNLKSALSYPVSLIDYLLKQSVSLDSATVNEGALLLAMANERTALNTHIKTLENYLRDNPSSKSAQKAHEFYNEINDNWDYIGSLDAGLGIYNHRIKYFACLLIEGYADLRETL